MRHFISILLLVGLGMFSVGCAEPPELGVSSNRSEPTQQHTLDDEGFDGRQELTSGSGANAQCEGEWISAVAVERMIQLTQLTDHEDIYSTYSRIDAIAALFEACGDPWGLFPTTYRHITARGIKAIEEGDFADEAWAHRIIVDFASRYMANLQAALKGEHPSWSWSHYYTLADRHDVSKTRAVIVAMVAHLTDDLPYSLVAIESTDDNERDFFVFGEMMIEVAPDFIEDLRYYYDTDTEDILTGFFVGDWVDSAFGKDTTITLSYQTIRTKSWNNRWLLEQSWGGWIVEGEIYSSFWAVDGVLAALDAAGTI